MYEGTPRQNYEEVLRSIGAFLDQRAMRDVLLTEAPDGFIVQGLAGPTDSVAWAENAPVQKETYTFLDDDIARFMEEASARRGQAGPGPEMDRAGAYERAFRVLGRYFDQQKPRDVFFFEQARMSSGCSCRHEPERATSSPSSPPRRCARWSMRASAGAADRAPEVER